MSLQVNLQLGRLRIGLKEWGPFGAYWHLLGYGLFFAGVHVPSTAPHRTGAPVIREGDFWA